MQMAGGPVCLLLPIRSHLRYLRSFPSRNRSDRGWALMGTDTGQPPSPFGVVLVVPS